MDRGHPRLGPRQNILERLASIFQPLLIDEIGCSIRSNRPRRHGNQLQQADLQLQLLIGGGEFPRSLRDSLIEFVGKPLLFATQSSFVQRDHRLVGRHS